MSILQWFVYRLPHFFPEQRSVFSNLSTPDYLSEFVLTMIFLQIYLAFVGNLTSECICQ